MFAKRITDSDAFIEMPSATQALYFHLNQAADDDGFNNQIQTAMMKAHASADDLKILLIKRFIIRFESGVIVIKHWRMHNTLRKDRYTPTAFQEELAQLHIKENQSYSLSENHSGCQVVAKRLPQVSIGKVSIDNIELPNGNSSSETSSDHQVGTVPKVIDFYNQHRRTMPAAKTSSKRRKGYINARVQQYGIDRVREVILKAEKSDFLNGGGPKGWVAGGLDWIMGPENFPKVLEGKYDNREPQRESGQSGYEGMPEL